MIETSNSTEETFSLACSLSANISAPKLIGLTGELGTGKTIFAKGIAHGLGVKELVTSPTFLGISEYYSGRFPFIHMDFYKKVIPIETINFYLSKPSIVLIEWIKNFEFIFNESVKLDISVEIKYGLHENERLLYLIT